MQILRFSFVGHNSEVAWFETEQVDELTGRCLNSEVMLSEVYNICPCWENTIIKPSNASNMSWLNSSSDKNDGFQFSLIVFFSDLSAMSERKEYK